MTAPLFAADSIGKSFGRRTVLKAASVWAWPGRITVLMGRNGSGKSTLLKAGVGVIAADHGVVRFDGGAWARPRPHQLASRGLFYLPDRNELLSARQTLGEHLAAVEWRFGAGAARGAVEALGIGELLDRRPYQVSGGERRRAELAVAWACRPRCLLADEPLVGIDPADADEVGATLVRMAREGCAVIVTGHDKTQLLRIADEVVWMAAGTTHALGTPASAARHDQFRREYLGPAVDRVG